MYKSFLIKWLMFCCIIFNSAFVQSGNAIEKPLTGLEGCEIQADAYWFLYITEYFKDLREDDRGIIRGYAPGAESASLLCIKKEETLKPEARTKGYVRAIPFALSKIYKHSWNSVAVSLGKRILKKTTGLNFDTEEQWRKWFEENKPFLQYSPEQGKLVIVKENSLEPVPQEK